MMAEPVAGMQVQTFTGGFAGGGVVAGASGGLRFTIISAKNLRDADWLPGGGKSDPYVVVEVPGKPHATWKTQVINGNTNPVWNATHHLAHWAPGDQLVFTVYDSDPMKGDDVLGKAVLA